MSPLVKLILVIIIVIALACLIHCTYYKPQAAPKRENYLYNPMNLAYTTDN